VGSAEIEPRWSFPFVGLNLCLDASRQLDSALCDGEGVLDGIVCEREGGGGMLSAESIMTGTWSLASLLC
jgi:hypothetical protein